MPTFPIKGKPDVNLLEQFFEPTNVVEQRNKAVRMALSEKARQHRAHVKAVQQRRDMRGVKGS